MSFFALCGIFSGSNFTRVHGGAWGEIHVKPFSCQTTQPTTLYSTEDEKLALLGVVDHRPEARSSGPVLCALISLRAPHISHALSLTPAAASPGSDGQQQQLRD